jgi:hypothetical protein
MAMRLAHGLMAIAVHYLLSVTAMPLDGLREECQCLPGQPRELHDDAYALTACEIESHDFVLGNTAESPIDSEAKPAWFTELGHAVGRENAHQSFVVGIILADGCYRIGCTKRCSLETMILPFGATTRSSGLSSGSITNRDDMVRPPGANATIVSSPSPFGPTPDARKNLPSCANANPRGYGTKTRAEVADGAAGRGQRAGDQPP